MVALLFGQLNKCFTLRDIVIGFNISADFLADIGLKQSPARSTMSYGHKRRDWQVFEFDISIKLTAKPISTELD